MIQSLSSGLSDPFIWLSYDIFFFSPCMKILLEDLAWRFCSTSFHLWNLNRIEPFLHYFFIPSHLKTWIPYCLGGWARTHKVPRKPSFSSLLLPEFHWLSVVPLERHTNNGTCICTHAYTIPHMPVTKSLRGFHKPSAFPLHLIQILRLCQRTCYS